jgi:hypothetical protein
MFHTVIESIACLLHPVLMRLAVRWEIESEPCYTLEDLELAIDSGRDPYFDRCYKG